MSHWYAVHCNPRMEFWARSNLWQREFDVYLPLYAKLRSHARRRDIVRRPLFPGYLFVSADLERGQRRSVNTAPGVLGMVTFGNHSPTVPAGFIDDLRKCEGPDGCIRLETWLGEYRRGERLKIQDGTLAGLSAVFECQRDDQRVMLFLDLLGRDVLAVAPNELVTRDL